MNSSPSRLCAAAPLGVQYGLVPDVVGRGVPVLEPGAGHPEPGVLLRVPLDALLGDDRLDGRLGVVPAVADHRDGIGERVAQVQVDAQKPLWMWVAQSAGVEYRLLAVAPSRTLIMPSSRNAYRIT